MQISKRVQQIEASQSLVMAARAKEMQAAGIDVISMSLGEPDMDTPESVRRAAQAAIDNHWSHYGPVPGLLSSAPQQPLSRTMCQAMPFIGKAAMSSCL